MVIYRIQYSSNLVSSFRGARGETESNLPPLSCTSQSNHRQHTYSTLYLYIMSLSMLRTSLRSGQPSIARGLATSAIRSNSSQPLKPAHPADVVSGNVAGPPTVHESPRVLAAEVVSDAPRMSSSHDYTACSTKRPRLPAKRQYS